MDRTAPLTIRLARRSDVPELAVIYAEDDVGGHGDSADPAALEAYLHAYDVIEASPNEMLYVAESGGAIVGTFQLAVLTKLTGRGSRTLMLQSVQVRSDLRGQGIGAQMIEFAIQFAKDEKLSAIQLMSNAQRLSAHRFYMRLGFIQSHFGLKKYIV